MLKNINVNLFKYLSLINYNMTIFWDSTMYFICWEYEHCRNNFLQDSHNCVINISNHRGRKLYLWKTKTETETKEK